MTNLNIAGQSVQDRFTTQFSRTEQTAVGVTTNVVPAKEFAAQAAQQPGAITALLSGQSLMTSYAEDKAILAEPSKGGDKINAEQRDALVKLSDNLKNPSDEHKLDLVAASASTLFSSQINTLQTNRKESENTNSSVATRAVSSNSGSDARTHSVIENGTDITAPQKNKSAFINVLGDMPLIEAMTALTTALNQAEAIATKSSANAAKRMVNSAERAGDKSISAARQHLSGAGTSFAMGLAGQGITSMHSIKALRNEKVSINTNLADAHTLEKGLGKHLNEIKQAGNAMLQKGNRMDKTVEGAMAGHHAKTASTASTLRDNHSITQNKTQRVRTKAEYGNQITHGLQNAGSKGFDLAAANESKQAELARADQSVNNELSNTHQQTAKKANETRNALNQVLETTLNANSSAASSIAERMR